MKMSQLLQDKDLTAAVTETAIEGITSLRYP
jgi:hypothetical protein